MPDASDLADPSGYLQRTEIDVAVSDLESTPPAAEPESGSPAGEAAEPGGPTAGDQPGGTGDQPDGDDGSPDGRSTPGL